MSWLTDMSLGRRIAAAKRVLLTWMSGTGKSSVIRALRARGFRAVDTDDGRYEPWPASNVNHEIPTRHCHNGR